MSLYCAFNRMTWAHRHLWKLYMCWKKAGPPCFLVPLYNDDHTKKKNKRNESIIGRNKLINRNSNLILYVRNIRWNSLFFRLNLKQKALTFGEGKSENENEKWVNAGAYVVLLCSCQLITTKNSSVLLLNNKQQNY